MSILKRRLCFVVSFVLLMLFATLLSINKQIRFRIVSFNKVSWKDIYTKQYWNQSTALFRKKPLVIWSNDYHISPINDLKHLLQPLGVRFIDKSLSGHCHLTRTCQGRNSLKVINVGNAMNLDPALVQQFYDAYKDDPEMNSVDAFVCFHPSAMCELFEPFNKSLLIIASTRYELGRFGKERWTKWNNNLIRYASAPWNVVGGNNEYDVKYIQYFTGIIPRLLPSLCDYIGKLYVGSRQGFLVAPIHSSKFANIFFEELLSVCRVNVCSKEITSLRNKYPHYKYEDLTAHQGIIYVPYQVSVMSLFEQYRMNIPLFFPSVDLLASWQYEHMVMNERTWDGVSGRKPNRSAISPHPSQAHIPDPNNESDVDAIRYWIQFSDFYRLPHITYYTSIPDLVSILNKLNHTHLQTISEKMKQYNKTFKRKLVEEWTEILFNVAKHSSNFPS